MGKLNEAFRSPPITVCGERGSAKGPGKQNRATVPEDAVALANDVERDIVEYLRAHHGVEADEITDESTLVDLGLDSLGVFAIGDILQSKYGISLDDERIAGVRTFAEFKTFIFMNRAKRARAEQPS